MRQRHNTVHSSHYGRRIHETPVRSAVPWRKIGRRSSKRYAASAAPAARCGTGAVQTGRRGAAASAGSCKTTSPQAVASTSGNGGKRQSELRRRHPRRSPRLRTPAATRGDRRSGRQQGRREGGVAAACGEARSDRERAGGGRKLLARAKRRGERRRSKRAWGTVVLTVEGSIRFRGWWSRATRSAACRERMSCLECPACRTNRTVCCTRHLRYQRGE